jgi:uncharacterized protein YifN (PemK superfamily)
MASPSTPPSDPDLNELCKRHGFIRPSRRTRIINSTPRVRQYFWVDFPHDAYVPEFVGEHPGIVIRAARHLNDTCMIVPITSRLQKEAKHIYRLQKNPNRQQPNLRVWAVCDHIYTIHTARLRPLTHGYHPYYPRVSQDDMEGIYACIRHALRNVFMTVPDTPPRTTAEVTVAIVEASD